MGMCNCSTLALWCSTNVTEVSGMVLMNAMILKQGKAKVVLNPHA